MILSVTADRAASAKFLIKGVRMPFFPKTDVLPGWLSGLLENQNRCLLESRQFSFSG